MFTHNRETRSTERPKNVKGRRRRCPVDRNVFLHGGSIEESWRKSVKGDKLKKVLVLNVGKKEG